MAELSRDRVNEVHITAPSIRFPVLDREHGGFGQIVVTLERGQRELVEVNGYPILVIRDYVN